jgi:hypothetical protein
MLGLEALVEQAAPARLKALEGSRRPREVSVGVRADRAGKRGPSSGRGIGWIDAHLLASAVVGGFQLWTADSSLEGAARDLGVSCSMS